MLHIRINYRMRGFFDGRVKTVETNVTLPMADEMATELLDDQSASILVKPVGIVFDVLNNLAILQGYYDGVEFISADWDKNLDVGKKNGGGLQ